MADLEVSSLMLLHAQLQLQCLGADPGRSRRCLLSHGDGEEQIVAGVASEQENRPARSEVSPNNLVKKYSASASSYCGRKTNCRVMTSCRPYNA